MWRHLAAIIVLAMASVLAGQEAGRLDAAADVPQRVADLIQRLDAPKAEDRDAASAELRKIGEPALPFLEKTVADPPSIEVKFRAQEAIDGIKLDLSRKEALKIDDILAQAGEAQKPGWDGKGLESQLDALVRVLGAETGRNDFKLPVTLKDLQQPAAGIGNNQGVLLKDKRVKVSSIDKSIVLCDSVADISFARNSIIIARVAACLSQCENCLVIAGRLAVCSQVQSSVVLCNARVESSFVRQSVVAGPEQVTTSIAESSVFVNGPAPGRRIPGDPREPNCSVEVKGIVFGNKSAANRLEGKLTLTLAMQYDQAIALFKLPDGTGEYVARYEQEIKTPQGQPIESLKGWKLIYAGNRLAVFANGEEIGWARQGM
jgi:hypothetical protein